jgi:hypothetical protein
MEIYKIKNFKRNGEPVFLDLIRDTLVQAKDEETVRQNILLELLNKWKIPKSFIEVEKNMSDYKRGARDRADIIILHPVSKEPWILFELKARDTYLCDDTLRQANKYNKILNCRYICLSNQSSKRWFSVENKTTLEIESPTSIDSLLAKKIDYVKEEPFLRPTLAECNSNELAKTYISDYYVIGQDTPCKLHPFIINFDGLLMENKKHISEKVNFDGFSIIEDAIRDTTFGNASGGKYEGLYRYYIIQFPNGDHNIVSIAVFGTAKIRNDPRLGNRNSYTSLVVAIDDYDKKHNSLQLNLDKNLCEEGNKWIIYHDVKLTSGKKGASKKAVVIGFCKKYIPDLISGGRVCLGEVPKNRLLTWKNSSHLIINLIRYALVRDKFR